MESQISKILAESASLKEKMLKDQNLINKIAEIVDLVVNCYGHGGAVYFCGNGGSAADAQHLAAEFTGRFYLDRAPLKAEALHVNPSFVTAVANDYSYDKIYSRAIAAQGSKGDILFCLSTSGSSTNIIAAAEQARLMGITTVAMTGNKDNPLSSLCDLDIKIDSDNTPRIQEAHMLIGHIICQLVESKIFA